MNWPVAFFLAIGCHFNHAGLAGMLCEGAPSVIAVEGDMFNGADVASIFFTGCQFECQLPAPQISCSCKNTKYHAPDSWPDKRQIHLDPTIGDYSNFYHDKRFRDANGNPGEDEAKAQGLERSRIVFYAGEGSPEGFAAIGSTAGVNLGDFSLGDLAVRYLFMTSCNVFAHGQRTAQGDFDDPSSFKAVQFKPGLSLKTSGPITANVFYAWGQDYGGGRRPLNPSLRLACGGSSLIGGADEYDGYPTHLFWYYTSVRKLNPADSWLVGLYVRNKAEPLCISRGDTLSGSGLRDPWFQREPLTKGEPLSSIFIEYPVGGSSDDPLVMEASKKAPVKPNAPPQPLEAAELRVLRVNVTSVPSAINIDKSKGTTLSYGSVGGAANLVAPGLLPALFSPPAGNNDSLIHAEDICVEMNPASGSVAVSWRPDLIVDNQDTARQLDAAANDFLLLLLKLFDKSGPSEISVRSVNSIQMKVDTVPGTALLQQPVSQDGGCLYLRLTRSVGYEQDNSVPIFGEGGETFIGRCPAATIRVESPVTQARHEPCKQVGSPLATFVYTNREIINGTGDQAKVALRAKTAVLQDARSRLGLPPDIAARYRPEELRLGYKAAPVHCVQSHMYPVYEVDFTADDSRLPLRTVEVPAQDLEAARTMEDSWTCSPE
jgi:hypothetical protein